MTRKRFIKLLMARGWSRNRARDMAKRQPIRPLSGTGITAPRLFESIDEWPLLGPDPFLLQVLEYERRYRARAAADVACVAHALSNTGAGGGKA